MVVPLPEFQLRMSHLCFFEMVLIGLHLSHRFLRDLSQCMSREFRSFITA